MLNKQMKMFQDGGMMDNSGEVVNGTEVPAGSLRSEVADDIPAKLSEGEFVLPADVVRFIGLEKLMKMRDAAKAGLARMQEMGQMGNAQEVANPDQSFAGEEDTSGFESEIDSIMQEVDGDQQFASGGLASVSGTDTTKAVANPMIDVRYFKSDDGRSMYITFYRGKPMTPIPDGFKEVTAEEARQVGQAADTKAAASSSTQDTTVTGEAGDAPDSEGTSGSTGSVGGGISLGNAALGLAALADLGKNAPSVFGQGLSAVANAASQSMANQAMNQMAATDAAIAANNVADTGMFSVSHADGSVSTVSNADSIAAQNAAVFGGQMDAEGNFSGTQGQDTAEPGFDIGLTDLGGNVYGGGESVSSDGGVSASGMSGSSMGIGSVGDDATGPEGESGDGGDGGGSGPCFITTAAVEHMNEKDEGELLTKLRWFRDEYMKKDKEMMKDIGWYYDNAPAIVKKLNSLKNSKAVYKRIYMQYLRPAKNAIDDGNYDKAYEIYKNMVGYASKETGLKEESFKKRDKAGENAKKPSQKRYCF